LDHCLADFAPLFPHSLPTVAAATRNKSPQLIARPCNSISKLKTQFIFKTKYLFFIKRHENNNVTDLNYHSPG
jgi:hypothetical protein